MWLKICANTNVEDALLAAELGADALGFVFAESSRQVTAQQVKAITRNLPPTLELVGVFTHHTEDQICAAVAEAGLTAVQLHRGIDLDLTRRLMHLLGPKISIIQTVHWRVDAATEAEREVAARISELARADTLARVLVDAKLGARSGGLGVPFDWALARRVLSSQPKLQLIVAGGLTPENVAVAIRDLAPWGVDVASGVEKGPGRKDPEKLKRFIANARGA